MGVRALVFAVSGSIEDGTSAALPKPFCLAISAEKARALVTVAIWLVLDRCNYIINGAFDRVV